VSALPSPPAHRLRPPRWLDARLGAGIALVLVSVVVGARMVSAAGATTRVYAATTELAAGSQLAPGDVTTVRTRLFANGRNYVDAGGPSPVGRVLLRPVGRGELLPVGAVADLSATPATRLVTVPLSRLHVPPDVEHGALVDVFATYVDAGQPSRTAALLRQALVERSIRPGTGALSATTTDTGLVLRLRSDQVNALVAAVQTAKIDVVRVLPGTVADDVGGDPVAPTSAPGGMVPAPAPTSAAPTSVAPSRLASPTPSAGASR
jgi:hypothetical protein